LVFVEEVEVSIEGNFGMRSINRVQILGHVGKVIPLQKVTKIDVGTNRYWKDESGKNQTATDWCTLTVLDEKTIEFVGANVVKGDPIYAEARVANSTFERNGQKVYSTDLIVSLLNRFEPANNEFSV
jgi:single-strand DNA-binding protein